MGMKFRYVIYGDIYTVEEDNKGLAREEAVRKVEDLIRQLPSANLDSLVEFEDLLNGDKSQQQEVKMICQNCQKSVGKLVQVKDILGIIIGVCEECSVYFVLVV